MKYYIILTHGIVNVGGGQLYVNSKREKLISEGWVVRIFSFYEGEILIDGLKKDKSNIIEELHVPPFYFRRRQREFILKKMVNNCNLSIGNNEVIVESNSITLALWGELLSQRINAKHLIFNLNELPKVPTELKKFFLFKIERHEYAGISPQSVSSLFNSVGTKADFNDYVLIPYNKESSFVNDDEKKWANIDFNNINIGVIGRLAKPYIKDTIQPLKDFFEKRSERKFNLIYIGGDEKETNLSDIIKDSYRQLCNVNLYMMGFMFPLPISLVKKLDVCIGSAGVVLRVSKLGVPVIAIDANDSNPIGIFGVTTYNTTFRESEIMHNLEYWLDSIIDKIIPYDKDEISKSVVWDEEISYQSHFEYIYASCSKTAYMTTFENIKTLKSILFQLAGHRLYKKMCKR